jgi:hypothetical protein
MRSHTRAGRSAVEGAHDAQRPAVDDVRVDHRGAHVLVAEQGLDGADVGAGFEQVGGEAVAEGVAARALVDAGGPHGVLHGLLHRALVQVVEAEATGGWVGARARRGEDVLPREAGRRVRHLRAERVGEVDLPAARGELRAVATGHAVELRGEWVARAGPQERGSVARALAATHRDLAAVEVDVLRAQREGFEEAQARAVEELADETEGWLQVVEQRDDLAAREHRREVHGAVRAFEAGERRDFELEHLAVEEHQRAEGLVLRRGRGATADREVVEEGRDLWGAELAGVTALVEADELARPVDVRLLRARGVVEAAEGVLQGFDERHGKTPGARWGKRARGVIEAAREMLRVWDGNRRAGGAGAGTRRAERKGRVRGLGRREGVRELGRGGRTAGGRGYDASGRPTTMLAGHGAT